MEKRFRLRTIGFGVLGGLLGLIAASCGAADSKSSASKSEPVPQKGGTLVVAIGAEPDSLNIYMARAAESMLVANRILPRLAREIMPKPGTEETFEPELARAWKILDGGKTLKVDLEPGGTWSDGTPITCEDLVFTLQAQTSPAVAWRGASLKRHIQRIDCPDPLTALFRFDRAYPGQFMDANDLNILPRSLKNIPFEKWRGTDWAARLPAGGPFRVASVRPGQDIVLERNPGYWQKDLPYLDKVVLRIVPEPTGRVTGLLSGEFDIAETLSPDEARRVSNQTGVTLLRRPEWSYSYLGWNTLDPAAWKDYRQKREAACTAAKQKPCPMIRRRSPHCAAPIPTLCLAIRV